MKRVIVIMALFLAVLIAKAGDLSIANAYYTFDYSTNVTGLNTNAIVFTNYVGDALYHTFYFTSTSNLNGSTATIAFGGDRTNFNTWGTLVLSATGGAAQNNSTNAVFKQSWMTVSITGTNMASKFTYLGGR